MTYSFVTQAIAPLLITELQQRGTESALALIPEIEERAAIGLQSYGEPLSTATRIDAVSYALEEAIDLAKYLRLAVLRGEASQEMCDRALLLAEELLELRGKSALLAKL